VDLLRCQWTCGDVNVIFGPVEMSVESNCQAKMSVDLWRCLWTYKDVNVIFGDGSVIFGPVKISVDLSRCQCDLWT
jgi:hypothetical protein